MDERRASLIALAISLLIHMAVLVLYSPLAGLLSPSSDAAALEEQAPAPIVFDLVETPDDAIERRPDEAAHVSNRDAVARNEERPEDLPAGDAYSEGISDHAVFRGESAADQAAPSGAGEPRELPDPEHGDMSDMVIRVPVDLGKVFEEGREQPEKDRRASEHRPFTDDVDLDHRTSAANELGGITLNTYNWEFADYILAMKKKLRSNTHPPGAFSPLGLIDGRTVLRFRVMPDGTVAGLEVLGYQGDRTLMETSVDAVESSSPFKPLPDDFPEEYLELTWTFIFYVYR